MNTLCIARALALPACLVTLMLVVAPAAARADAQIRSLSEVMVGHSVGGVAIDLVGNVYVADFGDFVWKITQAGVRQVYASGLYGASGNAIDNEGNVLQSNFHADSITKIDRTGQIERFVSDGLSGPVGIAIDKQTHDVYVANCRGNSITRISKDGAVSPFARSDLFNCPNGAAFDHEGNLYVVNFRDNHMLKIDPLGVVARFATVSAKGLGHLCFKDQRFYVTASQSNEIYEVTLDGAARRILGTGERGIVDGAGTTARLSSPNGIACHPWAPRLYINEFINDSLSTLPQRAIIREIILSPSAHEK